MPLAGPVSILFLRKAAAGHRRACLGLGLGAALGDGFYTGLAAFGYGFVLESFPEARKLLAGLGMLVMIALGAYFLAAAAPLFEEEAPQKGSGRLGFGLGLSMTLLNPTILLNWSVVLAMLHGRGWGPESRPQEAMFTLGVVAGIVGWFYLLEAILRRSHGRIPKKALSWAVRIMGGILLVTGLISLTKRILKA